MFRSLYLITLFEHLTLILNVRLTVTIFLYLVYILQLHVFIPFTGTLVFGTKVFWLTGFIGIKSYWY